MPFELLDNFEPVTPSDSDVRLAQQVASLLSRLVEKGQPLRFRAEQESGEPVEIPAAAAQVLVRLIRDLAAGHTVAVVPVNLEVTTQQAAEMLGVSRQFLMRELEGGGLPHRMEGTQRRIALRDLFDYKRRIDAERRKVLDELAADGQDLGMGY